MPSRPAQPKLSAQNRWVSLRPPRTEDSAPLALALRRSRSLHRPWTHVDAKPEALAAWIERAHSESFTALLALDRANAQPVAVFNLSQIFYGPFCNAYLGYYALAPYLGQGWTRAALPLVLEVAFAQMKLHRLEANIQPGNTASIALVRGAGFRHEGFSPRYLKIGGRWRDHERFALTAEAWRAARPRPPAPRAITAA